MYVFTQGMIREQCLACNDTDQYGLNFNWPVKCLPVTDRSEFFVSHGAGVHMYPFLTRLQPLKTKIHQKFGKTCIIQSKTCNIYVSLYCNDIAGRLPFIADEGGGIEN